MMHAMKSLECFPVACALLSCAPARSQDKERGVRHDWVWGGGPENMHYSQLAQINRSNVKKLATAWTFDTGEQGGLPTSPIIGGKLPYGITPTTKIFALHPGNGNFLCQFH